MTIDAERAARLSIVVEHPGGWTTRFAEDEPDAAFVPTNIRFSTATPGGFRDATFTLRRRLAADWPDIAQYDTVRILGPGGETAWEGRVASSTRSSSAPGQDAINVQCVGWAAALKDAASLREIYVDRDMSRWGGFNAEARLERLNFGATVFDPDVREAGGRRHIVTHARGPWPTYMYSEAWYDAHGIPLSAVGYAWERLSAVSPNLIDPSDTFWSWMVGLTRAPNASSGHVFSPELRGVGPGQGTVSSSQLNHTYAWVTLLYFSSGGGGAAGASYEVSWTTLAVYGRAPIPAYGAFPQGYLASDIIKDIVTRFTPLNLGEIQASDFVIPQIAFLDAVLPEDGILEANKYHLWDWAVWEDRRLHYTMPNPEKVTWEARLGAGDSIELRDGGAVNGVTVNFTHPTLGDRVAGPPGSGATVTDVRLADTSAANDANRHGLAVYEQLRLTTPTTDDGAIRVGAICLKERLLPQHHGTITIAGDATRTGLGGRPPWAVRAGHGVRVADAAWHYPVGITQTDYDHDSRAVTCTIGTDVAKLDAILERIGVQLNAVIA